MTFKAGDRVRVVKNPFEDEIALGATGTVAMDDNGAGPLVRLDEYPVAEANKPLANLIAAMYGDPKLADCHPFYEDELELLHKESA